MSNSKRSSANRRAAALSLFLLTFTVLLCGCDQASKRHLEALRKTATDTPLYPDFQQVRSYDNNKFGQAVLIQCYNSSATLGEVKGFYSQVFTERGWAVFPEEERTHNMLQGDDLAFRKGVYVVGIKQDKQPSGGCKYVMTYFWEEGL